MIFKIASAVVATVFASSAMADQCYLVDQDVAMQAQETLLNLQASGASYVEYISTIETNTPGAPTAVEAVEAKKDDWGNFYSLKINNRPVDLAYIFVPNDNGDYVNLGLQSGCTTCIDCVDQLP